MTKKSHGLSQCGIMTTKINYKKNTINSILKNNEMKTKLLIFLCLIALCVNAQTTHDLNWFTGIGNNVDLTIETGDTVRWTWTSPNHTVENVPGSSVETFSSGVIAPINSTWSYTFTVVGDNDYFCGVHGASSMSGTITVQDNLSLDKRVKDSFTLFYNAFDGVLKINLSQPLNTGTITIFDMLGKKAITQNLIDNNSSVLDISLLTNGFYVIRIVSDSINQSKQFLKY